MKFHKANREILTKQLLIEMANVRTEETGLPMVIYIRPRSKYIKHGPSIRVSKIYGNNISSSGLFSITISDNPKVTHKRTGDIEPKDIESVKEFIRKNQEPLFDLWYNRISPTEAVNKFDKVLTKGAK
ncbi:MAG TPA: hypothetical protein ENH82_15395 [bacterium]|nr:hypothetical protein [bacterium]